VTDIAVRSSQLHAEVAEDVSAVRSICVLRDHCNDLSTDSTYLFSRRKRLRLPEDLGLDVTIILSGGLAMNFIAMPHRHRRYFLCIAILLLTGCATVGPKYTDFTLEDKSKALVLIYRPSPPVNIFLTNTYAYAHAPDIYHEDTKLTGLNVNAYTYVEIGPGLTRISAREKLTGLSLVELEVNARAGQIYYLRYEFQMGLASPAYEFKIIPLVLAKEEIRKTRYVRASR